MRTDIFAASALLAQIASGEAPDPMRRVSNGVIEAGRPLPANVPPLLGRALLRGLDVDPDQRPQTIEQWLAEVDGALVALETNRGFAPPTMPAPVTAAAAPPVAPVGPATGQQQRRRWAVIGAAALIVLGGAGIAAAIATGGERPASSSSTSSPSSDAVPFSVRLIGPTTIKAGVQARWDVDAPGAVRGTWSLTGPVAAVPSDWSPGNYFQGTWNAPNPSITLTLVVEDANGNKKSKSITFAVE